MMAEGARAASAAPARHREPRDSQRGDTRQRIQDVALELFAEQGYDKTSLREIAERLGVTKAALYYHFQSKEDIVREFTHAYKADVQELVAWGQRLPRTAESRAAILARYADIVSARLSVIRFMEQNQAAMHSLMADSDHRKKLFREQFAQIRDLVTPPDATLRERVRATVAVVSVGIGCLLFQDEAASAGELREISLEIANELAAAGPVSPPPARH